jgi:hypothetical protein
MPYSHVSQIPIHIAIWQTYIESKKSAIAQMHPLQHADTIYSPAALNFANRQAVNTPVGDSCTLHQADPLQLGQSSQLHDAVVGQTTAARQINVADSIARLCKSLHGKIRNSRAVSEMNVV